MTGMTLAFTHCSNNFLAQAKTLLASIAKHGKGMKTFFFLADEKDTSIDYDTLQPAEFNVIDETIVPEFRQLVAKYNLLELNSNLKPFLFQYLLRKYPEATAIYYFDADTVLYHDLSHTDALLGQWDIIITPHFLSPLPDDGLEPFENAALNFGTFNLGFLALHVASNNTRRFLDWWSKRTFYYGHYDVANGYFVDQIWFNLVPVFFEKVLTLKHPGYNMAPWNLHERRIHTIENDGNVRLDSGEPLVLFHYSAYDYKTPDVINRKYNRHSLSEAPNLKTLFTNYYRQLKENGVETFSSIPCLLAIKKIRKPGPVRRAMTPAIQAIKNAWRRL